MSDYIVNPSLLDALEKAWCKETAYPLCQPQYDEKHPSWGNCFVSSIIMAAEHGLELIPGKTDMPNEKGIWHWCNDGVDTTWEQFDRGSRFFPATPQTSAYQELVVESVFNDDTLEDRLSLLVKRLETEGGYRTSKPAWQMIKQLQKKFDTLRCPNYVPTGSDSFTL